MARLCHFCESAQKEIVTRRLDALKEKAASNLSQVSFISVLAWYSVRSHIGHYACLGGYETLVLLCRKPIHH